MVVTCFYSVRHFPYKARPFSVSLLREGTGMIGFGLILTVAAFFMSWAWSFIAKFLTECAGQEFLGVYSAGYFLLVVKGRTSDSDGVYLNWLADKMLEKGVQEALNMDGGGTAIMVFMGERINKSGVSIRHTGSMTGFGVSEQVPQP